MRPAKGHYSTQRIMSQLWRLRGIFRHRLLNPWAPTEVAMSRTMQVGGWKFAIDGQFDFMLKYSAIRQLNLLRDARSRSVDVRISPNILIRMPPTTHTVKDYELFIILDSICVTCTICSPRATNNPRLSYEGKMLQVAIKGEIDQSLAYLVGYGWCGRGIYSSSNDRVSMYLIIALFVAGAIWQFDGNPASGAS